MDILKENKKANPFKEQEVWDKKKIIATFIVFILLFAGGVYAKNTYFPGFHIFPSSKSVKGVSTEEPHITPIVIKPINLQEKVQEIKNEVANLNGKDVATSSSQVQQILNQIKNLGNLPKSEAKQICERICTGF